MRTSITAQNIVNRAKNQTLATLDKIITDTESEAKTMDLYYAYRAEKGLTEKQDLYDYDEIIKAINELKKFRDKIANII